MTLETMTGASDSLLSSLWRASWQGALALLFVGFLCRVLARRLTADTHCWLWRLSYVKLLVGLVWSGAVLLPMLPPAPPLPSVTQPRPTFTSQAASELSAVNTGAASPVAAVPEAKPRLSWQGCLAAAYVFGVALCFGRLLLAALRTRHILQSMVADASEQETACAASLAQGMKMRRTPPLARAATVDSPVFIAGKVLLPADARYSEADLRMILAHELAHARRRDLLWEWLGTAVQVIFFFHPLVVLARREERLAREAAADALALLATEAPAAEYGKMLLSLSLEQAARRPMLLGAVGVIEGGTLLHRRLLALRDAASRSGAHRNRWRVALTIVPLTALVFVPWQMIRGQAKPLAALPSPIALPSPVTHAYPTMPDGKKEITGVVVNEKNEPLAGLTVSLTWHWTHIDKAGGIQMGGSSVISHVSTDAKGRFAFPHLPAGQFTYEVWSQANQYVNLQAPLVIGQADLQKTLHIVVSTGSLVTGRVVDGPTGKPLSGIYVGAGPIPPGGDLAKWGFWAMPSEAMTDTQGRYQVRVALGDDFVGVGRITNNTLQSRRIQYAVQKVQVVKGQTASAPDITVFLHPMIVCLGPDDRPVVNTTFRIIPDDRRKNGYMVDDQTDDTGTVVLNRGDSGAFRIVQGGRIAFGTFAWSPEQPLVIKMDDQTLSFPSGVATIHLTEGSASVVTGSVVSEDGKPIPEALVRIMETDPKSHYAVGDQLFHTDSSGVFRAPLDPNGEYHAYIRANGFNQISVSDKLITLVKGTTVSLGTVRLVRAEGFVSGRVVDSLGRPMSGVITYIRGGKTFLSSAMTDDQGRFRIPNVVSGEVLHLNLCLKGEVSDSGSVLLQSNNEMDIPGVKASSIDQEIVWHPHP